MVITMKLFNFNLFSKNRFHVYCIEMDEHWYILGSLAWKSQVFEGGISYQYSH